MSRIRSLSLVLKVRFEKGVLRSKLRKLTKSLLSVAFISGLILMQLANPMVQATSSADWSMFGHDPSHTGHSTSAAPRYNQTLWTFTTGDSVETSPAVVDGLVYVGSDDGFVYALNATDGELIWKYNTYGPVQSSPAIVDGVVYIGGFNSHAVFSLNAKTGALIWKSPTTSAFPNAISSAVVANDLVYVAISNTGLYGGELLALDAATGHVNWTYVPRTFLGSGPTVYSGKVYLGVSSGIVALDAVSGELSWRYLATKDGPNPNHGDGEYNSNSGLLVSDGLVVFGSARQTAQAWNASNGEFVWKGQIQGGPGFNTPALANGVIYFSTTYGGVFGDVQPGAVSALDAETGTQLWKHIIGVIERSSPAIADGVIFVGSNLSKIYALDSSNGETIWTYATGGPVCSSPAVVNGVLYVGSNDSKVYAIGTQLTSTPSATPAVDEFPISIVLLVALAVAVPIVAFRKRLSASTNCAQVVRVQKA
jgi:outer membrane protein assembly factor BamB